VFEDTDNSTIENTKPVHDFMADLGFRTTKSYWVREPRLSETGSFSGVTAADSAYRGWLLDLQAEGFEIGLHNACWATSTRQETVEAFDQFEQWFGKPCRTMANHAGNRESIYWGSARVSGLQRVAYNIFTRFRLNDVFVGHVGGSNLFWGDICHDRSVYLRNFTFRDLNTLKACPLMPYHDADRPFVRAWFASTEGQDAPAFVRAIREENQDRLEEEGGACIMYTHFASGFYENGQLHSEFARMLRRLVGKGGWFVPVGTLLDHIVQQRGLRSISSAERRRLERRWLLDKVQVGRS
jgi:hypothetical protein